MPETGSSARSRAEGPSQGPQDKDEEEKGTRGKRARGLARSPAREHSLEGGCGSASEAPSGILAKGAFESKS